MFVTWLSSNWQILLGGVLILFNEYLAATPSLQANSVIQFILGLFKALLPGSTPPTVPPAG